MLRPICIVFVVCLVLALRPQMAIAQVVVGTPTRAIQTASPGYCFTDLNDNDTVDLNEINVADGTEAMTNDAVPARDRSLPAIELLPRPLYMLSTIGPI